jgi:hypothetical protein
VKGKKGALVNSRRAEESKEEGATFRELIRHSEDMAERSLNREAFIIASSGCEMSKGKKEAFVTAEWRKSRKRAF